MRLRRGDVKKFPQLIDEPGIQEALNQIRRFARYKQLEGKENVKKVNEFQDDLLDKLKLAFNEYYQQVAKKGCDLDTAFFYEELKALAKSIHNADSLIVAVDKIYNKLKDPTIKADPKFRSLLVQIVIPVMDKFYEAMFPREIVDELLIKKLRESWMISDKNNAPPKADHLWEKTKTKLGLNSPKSLAEFIQKTSEELLVEKMAKAKKGEDKEKEKQTILAEAKQFAEKIKNPPELKLGVRPITELRTMLQTARDEKEISDASKKKMEKWIQIYVTGITQLKLNSSALHSLWQPVFTEISTEKHAHGNKLAAELQETLMTTMRDAYKKQANKKDVPGLLVFQREWLTAEREVVHQLIADRIAEVKHDDSVVIKLRAQKKLIEYRLVDPLLRADPLWSVLKTQGETNLMNEARQGDLLSLALLHRRKQESNRKLYLNSTANDLLYKDVFMSTLIEARLQDHDVMKFLKENDALGIVEELKNDISLSSMEIKNEGDVFDEDIDRLNDFMKTMANIMKDPLAAKCFNQGEKEGLRPSHVLSALFERELEKEKTANKPLAIIKTIESSQQSALAKFRQGEEVLYKQIPEESRTAEINKSKAKDLVKKLASQPSTKTVIQKLDKEEVKAASAPAATVQQAEQVKPKIVKEQIQPNVVAQQQEVKQKVEKQKVEKPKGIDTGKQIENEKIVAAAIAALEKMNQEEAKKKLADEMERKHIAEKTQKSKEEEQQRQTARDEYLKKIHEQEIKSEIIHNARVAVVNDPIFKKVVMEKLALKLQLPLDKKKEVTTTQFVDELEKKGELERMIQELNKLDPTGKRSNFLKRPADYEASIDKEKELTDRDILTDYLSLAVAELPIESIRKLDVAAKDIQQQENIKQMNEEVARLEAAEAKQKEEEWKAKQEQLQREELKARQAEARAKAKEAEAKLEAAKAKQQPAARVTQTTQGQFSNPARSASPQPSQQQPPKPKKRIEL